MRQSAVTSYGKDFPINVVKAEGCILTTDKGETFVDGLMGCGSLNFGHNDREMVNQHIMHISSFPLVGAMDFRTPEKDKFEKLLEEVLDLPTERAIQYTGPTGTNAVEAAIKLAREYGGSGSIAFLEGSYHGCTLGALDITDDPRSYSPNSPDNDDFCYAATHPADDNGKDLIARIMREDLSGVILEVVQGRTLKVIPDNILRDIKLACERTHTLLIVDEIQTGVWRTGRFLACPTDIDPDIIVMSKSLSGMGFPLAVVISKPEIDAAWQSGMHSGTFRGNGVAVNMAYHNLRLHKEHAEKMVVSSRAVIDGIMEVEGKGMMIGIKSKNASLLKSRLYWGLRLITEEVEDNIVKILLPLNIQEAGINHLFKYIDDVTKEINGE
jgi:diaminobutyrate-2-oxoglutarate transaminase